MTSVIALAVCSPAFAQSDPGQPVDTALPGAKRAESRPGEAGQGAADQTVSFSLPLVMDRSVFGDVFVEVSQSGDFTANADDLKNSLAETLNEEGVAALDAAFAGRDSATRSDLAAQGFEIDFDLKLLQLTVQSINPTYLKMRPLGPVPRQRQDIEFDKLSPARFSSYMNLTTNYDYNTRGSNGTPDLFFDGATRFQGVVIEYDGALTDQFTGSFDFFRRSTRAVYDKPGSFVRYSAGDLALNSLSVLRNAQIAGVAVEKRRQIFDPSFSVTRLSGQQIFLDNRSTVDVLIGGQQFDTFQLDPGTYDLSNLPVQQGANDIQLVIRDSFGRRDVIDYNFFFEPLALAPGEDEYSFGIGVLSTTLGFEPSYSGDIAASGYYRRALSGDLVLGAAVQASEEVQILAGTVTAIPQFIPGVFDLESAVSTSGSGTGFAMRGSYRVTSGDGFANASQFSVNVDYQSAGFRTIDNLLPINFDLLSVGATYSRSFGPRLAAVVGGSYVTSSSQNRDNYNVFLDVNYRVSDRLRLTFGGEYGRARNRENAFGVRVGLSYALGGRTRATVDYRSQVDSFRANVSRGADNQIGSFGYDVSVSRFGGDTQSDVQLEYVQNRFAARADISTAGQGFNGIFDDQRVRLQLGSSIAYADGIFGIGRPVSNSFLLARPHQALRDKGIVTARTLFGGSYYARSGALGAAVQGDVSPFSEQSIQFDAADPEDSFDVGDGTILIDPPYKSGFSLVIGDDHYVSIIGTLVDPNGPVSIVSGEVVALDPEEDFEGLRFFTNSAGRFGLFGLAPGKSYRIDISGEDRSFIIEVPEDSDPLIRMDTVTIEAKEE